MGEFGFFGKVPGRGDFVGAGLPSAFLEPWDAWTREALARGRARLGGQWETAFLSSPVWRFALAPGVCGAQGWAGVIASSADGVGRSYPLTVAAAVPEEAGPAALLSSWRDGFERMIDLSLRMQEADVSFPGEVAAAAATLDAIAFPSSPPAPAVAVLPAGHSIRVGPVAAGTTLSSACAAAFVQAGPRCAVLWRLGWGLPGTALVSCGLPDPEGGPTIWELDGELDGADGAAMA